MTAGPAARLVTVPVPLHPDVELPIAVDDPRLDTPAVLVDLDVTDANITRMAARAARAGVALRPHAKTHKSVAVGHRQLTAGAVGLCVATVTEALEMAAGGILDITLAYPVVGSAKLRRLTDLRADCRLTLVSDSDDVTDGYAALAVDRPAGVEVLIEVDTGMHRAGGVPDSVLDLARHVTRRGGLRFGGILTHAGHAHDVPGPREVAAVARAEAAVMGDLRGQLESAGLPPATVSAGSTLTAPFLTAADGITELRPGTYVYNDLRTLGSWSCTPDMIAATMLTTVVSTHGSRVTVDAGNKSLTMTRDPTAGFGYPTGAPGASFTRLSEEHGVLDVPPTVGRYRTGDRLQLLPVHVCAWMDLQTEVYGTQGGRIVERITVQAFRHSL